MTLLAAFTLAPAYADKQGLALARRKVGPGVGVQLTGRGDFQITARAKGDEEAIELATASAKAIRRSLVTQPGLATMGRGARAARRDLGRLGSALLGGFAGFWVGAAAAIVRRGSGRAPRRASPPCPPGRPAIRG
jgi:hypothetical protein